jgi:hypothetical protein
MVNTGCNMGKNRESMALATSKIKSHWEMKVSMVKSWVKIVIQWYRLLLK